LSIGLQNINNTKKKNFPELHSASNYTYLMYLFWHFFNGLTASVGLGLLIFGALWSHSGVDFARLLYTLVASEFTSSL